MIGIGAGSRDSKSSNMKLRDQEPKYMCIYLSTQGAPAGIRNLGNTCFASSVLQCLRAVPSLKAAICAAVSAGHGRATPVATELAQLLTTMEKAGPRIIISPARFATFLKFAALQFMVMDDGQ